jgi:hypothetical protein
LKASIMKKLIFTFQLLLAYLLMPLSVWAADEPLSMESSNQILRVEPWQKFNLTPELNYNPLTSLLTPLGQSNYLASLDLQAQIAPDLALGLGFGGWMPNLSLSLQGRYYLPERLVNADDVLPFSRLYTELRLAVLPIANYSTVEPDNQPSRDYRNYLSGYGAAPLFGIENRLHSTISRVAAGLALTRTPQGQFQLAPTFMMGLGYQFSTPSDMSPAYEAAYSRISAETLPPLFQVGRGVGLPEGDGWTAWLFNSQWGIGYGQGGLPQFSDRPMRLFKFRYYFSPMHLGDQGYCEAVASITESQTFGLRLGYEQRLATWLSLDFAVGIGLLGQAARGTQAAGGSIFPMLLVSTNYAVPLPLASSEP